MIIDCISDLHGFYPKLEGGDLLIVAGDLTARDTQEEHYHFTEWALYQNYKRMIYIAGNHDNKVQEWSKNGIWTYEDNGKKLEYLCDSDTEFEGLKIWGSPWTKTFKGMNPHCKAFTVDTEEELEQKWRKIPPHIDILITHEPPYGIFDQVDFSEGDSSAYSVGSHSLKYCVQMLMPKLHVFGHVHEGYGMQRPNLEFVDLDGYPIFVNASHVNERYKPVNKPIRIEL
jgi:Icc-related predicted phosphoesterase